MKTFSIARKSLLELWREPMLLTLLLFFPTALVGFYYVAFGQTESGLASYLSVLVLNQDKGVEAGTFEPASLTVYDAAGDVHTPSPPQVGDGRWNAGSDLIEALRQAEWEGDPVFDLQPVSDRRAAEIALRERKAASLIVIPPGFAQSLVDGAQGAETAGGSSTAEVILVGDPGSGTYVFAHSFLNGLLRQFVTRASGWEKENLTINYEFLPGTGTMSDFDWGVGGIVVFGIMFLVITTATVLVRENVTGTLHRLKLSLAGAASLLLGVTLAQMVLAAIQVPITFGAAVAMGFPASGSLALAMGIALLLSLSAVGLGLIVASFARSDGEAANLGAGVLVPMVFLSGALYPMPELPLFTIGDRTIQVYDLIPATHASEAMRRVLMFGEGPRAIAYELAALMVLSVVILAVGVVLYGRLRLRTA